MHPDAEALLNAIYDHPDDDTPRLVYADWLQEHGQDDYAHFIRLSIRAENPALPLAEQTRAQSQRKQYWKRMVAVRHDAIRHTPIQLVQFQRGMCDVVDTSGDTFLRTAESWSPAVAPRGLVVYGARGLGNGGIEARLVREVAVQLPWLRELALQSRPSRGMHEMSDLGYTPLSGSLFTEFATPGAFPRLVALSVSVAEVNFSALAALAASSLARRLRSLRLLFQIDRAPGALRIERSGREGEVREELYDLLERLQRDYVELSYETWLRPRN